MMKDAKRKAAAQEIAGVPPSPEEARALLKKYLGQRHATPFSSLEAAAEALCSVLEPSHQDIVRNTMQDQKWPMWVLICGAVARACDHRELHAGDYNSDWLNQPGHLSPAAVRIYCQACNLEIPNGRRGQLFCCSAHGSAKAEHSPGCPAALVAGVASPPTPATPLESRELRPSAPVVPAGYCQACALRIPNARPGQQFCCSAHGSGRIEHTAGCASAAAPISASVQTTDWSALDAPAAAEEPEPPDTEPAALGPLSFRGPVVRDNDPTKP